MKVYFLRITQSELTLDGDKWVTDIVDLYDNYSYTNFSVTKSNYGFSHSEPYYSTWIGLHEEGSTNLFTWDEITALAGTFDTDSGSVVDGRYIDKSGRIDLVSFNITSGPLSKLAVFTSDTDDDSLYESEWEKVGPISTSQEIALIASGRYAKFEFHTPQIDAEFEAFIRVEIDQPVMAPLYRHTRKMLDQYPSWMAIHETPLESATPELATPNTIGGSFLNAIAGEWLDDINRQLSYRNFQKYVSTVDLNQMAWAFKSSRIPDFIWSVEGDGTPLANTVDIDEFIMAPHDDAYFVDYQERILYTTKQYDELAINEELFSQEPHHVWNYVDEIGLLLDLPRLHLEDNETYQKRILDVYKNRNGVGVEALKLALRRELNLWKLYGATPDSDFEGATPEILEIEDIEKDPKYFSPDGLPTIEFVELVNSLSVQFPTTWGRFRWGKALWDVGGEDHSGYGVVPYRYDADHVESTYIQSGVGDGNDLFVFRPEAITGPREFGATLKLRGRQGITRIEYPTVSFDFKIRGRGIKDYYNHPQLDIWFTLLIVDTEGEEYYHTFMMSAIHDGGIEQFSVGNSEPSEESYAVYTFFSEDAESTADDIEFRHRLHDHLYDGTGVIPIEDIESVTLQQGKWSTFEQVLLPEYDSEEHEYDEGQFDGTLGAYTNIVSTNIFEAWFSHYPDTVLTSDQDVATPSWPTLEWTNDATPELELSSVILKSQLIAEATPDVWLSEEFLYHIDLNGVPPFTDPSPVSLEIPDIFWNSFVTNRNIELQLETTGIERVEQELQVLDLQSVPAHVETPSSESLDLTGDLDFRIHLLLGDWLPNEPTALISQYDDFSNRTYTLLLLEDGRLRFEWYNIEEGMRFAESTSPIPIEHLEDIFSLRMTFYVGETDQFDATPPATPTIIPGEVTFYTSTDFEDWDQLGDVVVLNSYAYFEASTAPIRIGSVHNSITEIASLSGYVFKAEIRDGIDGTVVASPDFTEAGPWQVNDTASTDARNDAQDNPWSLVNNAVISEIIYEVPEDAYGGITFDENEDFVFVPAELIAVDGDADWSEEGTKLLPVLQSFLRLDGDGFAHADEGLDYPTEEIRITAQLKTDWLSTNGVISSVWNPAINERAFRFRIQNGSLHYEFYDNSVTPVLSSAVSFLPVPYQNGETGWVRVTREGNEVRFYTSSDGNTWTQLGIPRTVSANPMISIENHIHIGTSHEAEPSSLVGDVLRFSIEEFTGSEFEYVTDVDFRPLNVGIASFTDSTDVFWALQGTAQIVSEDRVLELSTLDVATPTIYPIVFRVWELFEFTHDTTFEGVVDEHGPWRNGIPPSPGNTNFNFMTIEQITRDDFGVPNDTDYVVTWMGVESDNRRVIVWLDNNSVKPAFEVDNLEYPEEAIIEKYNEGSDLYFYEPFILRARAKPGPDDQWSPQIHSGYFYDRDDEYYFFANKKTETTNSDEIVLETTARQGAPIIVYTDDATPQRLRQVAFFSDEATSPIALSLTNTEFVKGNGTNTLYLAYNDIYEVEVLDENDQDVTSDVSSDTNEVEITRSSNHDESFIVNYKVRNSFYADYDHTEDGEHRTKLVFDAPPSGQYQIYYESSAYDPATPVDLALNPIHTMLSEGFVFISHNEYNLDSLRVYLSPSKILADGYDYMTISIVSMDKFGNPKPGQTFSVSTTFGTLSEEEVTTADDGCAIIVLMSEDMMMGMGTPVMTGLITITGDINAEVEFEVEEPHHMEPEIFAVPKAEQIQADGISENIVYGKIQGTNFDGVPDVVVEWRRARSIYELFQDGANIVFEDDFPGTSLDLSKWNIASEIEDSGIDISVAGNVMTIEGVRQSFVHLRSASSFSLKDTTVDIGVFSENILSLNEYLFVGLMPVGSNTTGMIGDPRIGFSFQREGSSNIIRRVVYDGEKTIHNTGQHQADVRRIRIRESLGVLHLDISSFGTEWDRTVPPITHGFTDSELEEMQIVIEMYSGDSETPTNGYPKIAEFDDVKAYKHQVVKTDENGFFFIGPFTTSEPEGSGYWFVSLEATVEDVTIGDVVFWYEYPMVSMGVENSEGLPQQAIQMATPVDFYPDYASAFKFVFSYDEESATPVVEQTPNINWLPPEWYAIPAWLQHKLGINSHKISKNM